MRIESAIVVALLSVPFSGSAMQAQSKPGAQTTKTADKATEPPSREALAALLANSHNKGAKLPKMVSFKAKLSVEPLGRDKDNITVEIDSRFRNDVPKVGGARRTPAMIRYSVDEGGKRLERGRDAYGFWFRSDGKVTPLAGRDFGEDRALVKKEISLARQLLDVVDPAAVLGQLSGKVVVVEGRLPFGKAPKASYWIATGTRKNYPYYTLQADTKRPPSARVSLYVNKATGILKAVQALHVHTGNSELVLFGDYEQQTPAGAEKTGVMLPTKLKIYQAVGGKFKPLVMIKILSSSLNPQLTAADFERQSSR